MSHTGPATGHAAAGHGGHDAGHDGHDEGHGGHGHGGADHVPHVLPLAAYFGVFAALIVLTIVTVGVSYVDFGDGNLVIALVVATIKASLVAAIFMHLRYDNKFHTIVFSFSIIFLGVFIALTQFDTFYRGKAEALEGERPASIDDPFGGTRADKLLKESYTPIKADEVRGDIGEKGHPEKGVHPSLGNSRNAIETGGRGATVPTPEAR